VTVSATAMLFGVYGQSTHTISALPVLALEKYLNATAGTRHLRASATWGAGKNRRQVDHGAHSGRRRPGGNELVALEEARTAVAASIPRAERQTVGGQTHMVDAKALTPVLERFFRP
jgi:hypothetical protein